MTTAPAPSPTPSSRPTANRLLRQIHRISAILFLLAIPPATYASIGVPAGSVPSPAVYLPLLPLLGLTLTGVWQLVAPWVRRSPGSGAGEAA